MAAPMTTLSPPEEFQDPIIELIRNYEELNGSTITELGANPSALEFMRYVAQNRPFVVRGAANDWEALRSWNVDFLKTALRGEKVNVAVTPYGYVGFQADEDIFLRLFKNVLSFKYAQKLSYRKT